MSRKSNGYIFLIVFTFCCALNAAAASKEMVLYNFMGGADGSNPASTLISDTAGNLYGTTMLGGQFGNGTIFELARSGSGWTQTVIYSFTGNTDGGVPNDGLTLDSAGNLYGTIGTGGVNYKGNVYRLSPVQGGGWEFSLLYSFTGGSDGAYPYGGVVLDKTGNLYGTAYEGGSLSDCQGAGCGVVYELSLGSDGSWTQTVLHDFNESDGALPGVPLVFDPLGNLYGTTSAGGASIACVGSPANGCGTVFQLAPTQGSWVLTTLHSFYTTNTDGFIPQGVTYHNGRLHGLTFAGGKFGGGTLFEVTLSKSGPTESILHNFGASTDGTNPVGTVISDKAGNLYGVTRQGGNTACSGFGCGTVFELTRQNGAVREIVLYEFSGGSDGASPQKTPRLSPNGGIMGTTGGGGTQSVGVVYEVPPVRN